MDLKTFYENEAKKGFDDINIIRESGIHSFLDEWIVDSLLGKGSYGNVYKIIKPQLGMTVNECALKVCQCNTPDEAEIRKQEIENQKLLSGHPNAVQIEDYAIISREPPRASFILIRMELLEPLPKSGLSREDVIKLGTDICSVLEKCFSFSKRMIHCDIKPANILVTKDGRYKLGDFGSAKTLQATVTYTGNRGTPFYMAPEVAAFAGCDSRCDIYSLGMVLYYLLNNNRMPFMPLTGEITVRDNEMALIRLLRGEPLPPPVAAEPQVTMVVLKACAYDRRQRFQHPAEFSKALTEAANGVYYPYNENYMQQMFPPQGYSPRVVPPQNVFMPPRVPMSMQQTVPMNQPIPMPMQQPVPAKQPKPEEKSEAAEKKIKIVWNKKTVIIGIIIAAAVILLCAVGICTCADSRLKTDYDEARELMNSGQYQQAREAFLALDDFEDSAQMAEKCENHVEYERAVVHMKSGYYASAKGIFDSLGTFGDSAQMAQKCEKHINYEKANELMLTGKYDEAEEIYASLGDFNDSADKMREVNVKKIKNAEVESIVEFGSYEQDNDTSNGPEPIRWIVLENNEEGMLLVSEQSLDCVKYNSTETTITWEKCSLRTWLNGDFYDTAFNMYEKDIIKNSTVPSDTNPEYGTTGGEEVNDQVFILSLSEIEKYFPTDADKRCIPTRYAVEKGVHTSSNYAGAGWWWARTPGYDCMEAVWIRVSGEPSMASHSVSNKNTGVRPATWLKYD